MTVLVCGSRDFNASGILLPVLRTLPPGTVIVHGGAEGADELAGRAAEELSLPTQVFPAEWRRHGRKAGPIRNAQMLQETTPDLCLAFLSKPLRESLGTWDMVKKCVAKGIPVRCYGFISREWGDEY